MHWVFIIFLACCCCILLSPWLCHIHRKIHRKQLKKSQNFSRHASREWPSSVSLIVSPRKRKITTKAMHDSVPSACKINRLVQPPAFFNLLGQLCLSSEKYGLWGTFAQEFLVLVGRPGFKDILIYIYIHHIRIYTVIIVVSSPLATVPEWISLIHVDTLFFHILSVSLSPSMEHSAAFCRLIKPEKHTTEANLQVDCQLCA